MAPCNLAAWSPGEALGTCVQTAQRTAVEGSCLDGQRLLLFRMLCLLLSVAPCVVSVRIYRQRQKESGEPLLLGGLEILLTFCTLWSAVHSAKSR